MIDLEAVDRAFRLQEVLAGRSLNFDLVALGAGPHELMATSWPPWVEAVSPVGANSIKFSIIHTQTDGFGALAGIRNELLGHHERPTPPVVLDTGGAKPARRTWTRLTHGRISLIREDRRASFRSGYFKLDTSGRDRRGTTRRLLAALHTLTHDHNRTRRRACSTVLVPVTTEHMGPGRAAANLSAAYLSVATKRDLATKDMDELLGPELRKAAECRGALLQRLANFGRIPTVLWPAVRFCMHLWDGPFETAVLSNLGAITDPELLAVSRHWFTVVPVRHPASLGVGLTSSGDTLCLSLSAYTSEDRLGQLGGRLAEHLGATLMEVHP